MVSAAVSDHRPHLLPPSITICVPPMRGVCRQLSSPQPGEPLVCFPIFQDAQRSRRVCKGELPLAALLVVHHTHTHLPPMTRGANLPPTAQARVVKLRGSHALNSRLFSVPARQAHVHANGLGRWLARRPSQPPHRAPHWPHCYVQPSIAAAHLLVGRCARLRIRPMHLGVPRPKNLVMLQRL